MRSLILMAVAVAFVAVPVHAQVCRNGQCNLRPSQAPRLPVAKAVTKSIVEFVVPPYFAAPAAPVLFEPVHIEHRVVLAAPAAIQTSWAAPVAIQTRGVTPASGNHWGYPGDLGQHLLSSHGISTAGMSHEQMLAAHDAAHRRLRRSSDTSYSGRAPVVTRYVRPFVGRLFFRR